MADIDIRNDFVEGMNEVFTALFNDGSEIDDGLFLYLLSENNTTNIYGEQKYKKYKAPKLLVCSARMKSLTEENDVSEGKEGINFTIPVKSLIDNGFDLTREGIDKMYKGVIKFHDVFYKIDMVTPSTYVEDTYLFYKFSCTEDIHTKSVVVEDV